MTRKSRKKKKLKKVKLRIPLPKQAPKIKESNKIYDRKRIKSSYSDE